VDFDAKRGENLYEVKTGYGWMTNPNLGPIWQQRRREVLETFSSSPALSRMSRKSATITWAGTSNSRSVAEYFQSLLSRR
jgi:hypothetical protein